MARQGRLTITADADLAHWAEVILTRFLRVT